MITYKTDCWQQKGKEPQELYLLLYRNEDNIGRIVIVKSKIYIDSLDFVIETLEDMNCLIKILKAAWDMKEEQDKKGWGQK